jgi:hypothetical protein
MVFALYSPSYLLSLTPTPPGQDLFCPPILNFVEGKRRKKQKKEMTFLLLKQF